MVRRRRSKVKASISGKSHQGDLSAESGAAEKNVSKSLIVDASENNTISQSEYEAIEEADKENNATVVGCSKVDDITIDAAEDEHIHEECAAEEVKMETEEAKGGEEGLNDCDEDVEFVLNDDDDDDFDEGDDGIDDYDDDDNGDSEFDFDDDEDEDEDEDEGDGEDDDEEEEEEHGYLMEEEGTDEIKELENNGNTVKESDESQGNRVAQEEKEENAKEGNEEREVGSSKKKEEISRKGKERKKITKSLSDKVAPKHNDKQEKDGLGDTMEEADRGNSKEDIQNKEGSSKQREKKLRKRRKVTEGGSEKLASKQDDKVGSSRRKKFKSMGMIFMCSSKTKKDCYHYKVLGLPANKRDIVGKIYKGMRLFLYDVDLKLLYGIYKAAGHGGYNIQPKAFNSQFPSQVRFTVLEDCLPLAEEKFKKVIKDNYFTKTKFDCQLTSQQVQNLCKLFVSASKGSKAIKSARRVKTHASTDQDRSRARREERRSMMAEKHRYHEHSHHHEREVVASAAAPVAAVPVRLIPPAAAPPSYAYDRTLELDAYRRDLYVEHHDSHRYPVAEPRLAHRIVYSRDPLLHQLDTYRRDVAAEHRDLRFRDEIGRRDPYISYRELPPEQRELRSRDDFGRHDPYFSYRGSTEDHNLHPPDEFRRRDGYLSFREVPVYRDRVYTADPLPETEHYRLTNRSEYHSAAAPLPEYRSTRTMYRY